MTQQQDSQMGQSFLRRNLSKFLGETKFDAVSRVILVEVILVAVVIGIFYPGEPKLPLHPVKKAVGWDTLMIDGNRNKHEVPFPHLVCRGAAGEEREDCRICHHLSRPQDGPSSCAECHKDMLYKISIFDHDYHIRMEGENLSCQKCHEKNKAKENAKSCRECHPEYPEGMDYLALSYKAAMHRACAVCHPEVDLSGRAVEYTECKLCHKDVEELMR